MSRIYKLIVLLCTLLAGMQVRAQTYFTSTEIGISVGGSQYFGDLNDRYGFKTIGFAGGLYARKHLNNYISLKLGTYYTQLSYADRLNNDLFQQQRNLDFTSNVVEMSFQAEFNFFKFVTGDPYHRFTPYLTGGLGAFMFDPYTIYQGSKYSLRPLGTEGQNLGFDDRKYSNVSACVPIGAGAKMWLKGGVNLTLEIASRLTFTDYLDDVSSTYVGVDRFPVTPKNPAYALQDRSVELDPLNPLGTKGKQRGNSSTRDQYLMCMFSISWHFTTYRCPEFMRKDLISTY